MCAIWTLEMRRKSRSAQMESDETLFGALMEG